MDTLQLVVQILHIIITIILIIRQPQSNALAEQHLKQVLQSRTFL